MPIAKPSMPTPESPSAPSSDQLELVAKTKPKLIPFTGTSHPVVKAALTATFGPLPIQLSAFDHEGILLGMMNAAGEGAAPYKTVLDALKQFGEIEVRAK